MVAALESNLRGRMLTKQQVAAYAVEQLPLYEKLAKERQHAATINTRGFPKKFGDKHANETMVQAAKGAGTNENYVRMASKLTPN